MAGTCQHRKSYVCIHVRSPDLPVDTFLSLYVETIHAAHDQHDELKQCRS